MAINPDFIEFCEERSKFQTKIEMKAVRCDQCRYLPLRQPLDMINEL